MSTVVFSDTIRSGVMCHPAKGAGIFCLEHAHPTFRWSTLGEKDVNGRPGLDKHSNDFQNSNVQFFF